MYIAMNHFRVKPDAGADFERVWRERRSYLEEVPGFQSFHLLRGPVEEGAQLYASHTVWTDQAAFTAWTESDAFRKAHAQGGKTVQYLMGPPRFVGWQAAEDGRQGGSGEDQIRTLVAQWADAMRAKDAKKVVSFFAPGNVMFVLAPPLQHKSGSSPGEKGVAEWFASFRGPLGLEVRDLVVAAGDEVAFCHSLNHLTGTKTDGERADYWFRETLGFRKVAGTWKITHDHESVPVHMDGTGKAAFDLAPE